MNLSLAVNGIFQQKGNHLEPIRLKQVVDLDMKNNNA